SVLSMFYYSAAARAGHAGKHWYLLLALLSVLVSAYFGSNLYAHFVWKTTYGLLPAHILKLTCLFVAVATATSLFYLIKESWSRVLTMLWVVFLIASLYLPSEFAAEPGFVAFSCLLLTFVAHARYW